MLNFFRKIRKQLATDNKPKQYLRYAIGEILLVVIGILVALQINSWNSQRLDAKKETVYLKNLHRDLKEQTDRIHSQILFENKIIENVTSVMEGFYRENKFEVDTLFISNTSQLVTRRTFVLVNTTYIALISTGNIDLIKNLVLKDEIISYYEYLLRVGEIIKQNNLIIDNQISPFLSELILMDDINLADLLSGYTTVGIKNNSIRNEEKLIKTATAILNKPEKELKLYNNLQSRKTISGVHKTLLKKNILKRTSELIESIEKLIKSTN